MDTQKLYEEWQNKVEARGKARGRAQGRAQGRAEGEAKGRAEALLRILDARNLAVSRNQLAKVRACTDIAILDQWIVRAITAESTREVLR